MHALSRVACSFEHLGDTMMRESKRIHVAKVESS